MSDVRINHTDISSQTIFIVDQVRTSSTSHGPFSGWQWETLRGKLLRAGFLPEKVRFEVLSTEMPDLSAYNVIVGLGEATLQYFTEKRGIDKWQMSPLTSRAGQKFIPTYDMGRIQKQYELGTMQEKAFHRAAKEALTPVYSRAEERFLLNPELEETFSVLDFLVNQKEISVDVETGYGQINTVGFAWSASDAIAINVLPARCGDSLYYTLWEKIARVLEGPSGKIFQNFIYDTTCFSAYGIGVRNITWDTMHAMKVLWPEFEMGLGNVGRFYTDRPYWKDDGKVESEEGKKKDWGNVRDWTKHYIYNCRDTTGTFEAALAQRRDTEERGLRSFIETYILRLEAPIREMCASGMPVDSGIRDGLKVAIEEKVASLTKTFTSEVGKEINLASPKQVQAWLREAGIDLPKKYDKAKGTYKETTDASAIKKIRLKHPKFAGLSSLAEIKTLQKALSSYINFEIRPDSRLTYSLNITGTETLRFSGNKDYLGRGFNIQTIPREGGEVSIKSMFVAPEGFEFVEVDLRQAESRFVAYDAADKTLIDMLESGADVHTHVGRAILKQMGKDPDAIPKDEFKGTWRQLGKKAGHGLNYAMKAGVFVETVFNELDMVISKKDAEAITAAYYGLFPGIPRWHAWIRRELYNKRKLSAPSGWERYFYGRPGDDMAKEAYAWRPQHSIPWITNHLMLHLCEERKKSGLLFSLLVQVHDSLILLCAKNAIGAIAEICLDTSLWHPEVILPGGKLVIPTEVKHGTSMDNLKEWTT